MEVHDIALRIRHMAAEIERLAAELEPTDKRHKINILAASHMFIRQAHHIEVQHKRQYRDEHRRRINPETINLRNAVVVPDIPYTLESEPLPEAVARIQKDDAYWENFFSKAASPGGRNGDNDWDNWDDE